MGYRRVTKLVVGLVVALSLIGQMLPAGLALAQDAPTAPNTVFLPLVSSGPSGTDGPPVSNSPVSLVGDGLVKVAQFTGVPMIGLPDADPYSGRFVTISRGLATLGEVPGQKPLEVTLTVPPTLSEFSLRIFDGDMGGKWDRLPDGPYDQVRYSLFADPDGVGNRDSGDLIASWLSSGMPDGDWCDVTPAGSATVCATDSRLANSPLAYNVAQGTYVYNLVAEWETPQYDDEASFFKIAVQGGIRIPGRFALLPGRTVGFQAFDRDYTDPARPRTGYDGRFLFYLALDDPQRVLNLFDGDFDHADDTDDANTPSVECRGAPANYTSQGVSITAWKNTGNLAAGCSISDYDPDTDTFFASAYPPFPASVDTLADGANWGSPRDDLSPGAEFLNFSPNVYWTLTAPGGAWTATNNDPSGQNDWEMFRVGLAGANVPDSDVTVPSIPAGFYLWRVIGLDAANNVFINSDLDVLPAELGAIGNTVWRDTNSDGFWHPPSEPGIAGVVLNLYEDVNANGLLDADDHFLKITTTNSDGQYLFDELPFAQYLVEVAPNNFGAGKPLAGLAQTLDRSSEPGDNANRPTPWPVTLDTNATYRLADFGYNDASLLGALGDYVWYDANANGLQDDGPNAGIGQVRVILESDFDGDGAIDYTADTRTDATGFYRFEGLPAGNYTVRVDAGTLPPNLIQTYDRDGIATSNAAQVTLAAGEENLDIDFGYVGTAAVGNYVWIDENADGYQDAGEPGLPNVKVTLTGQDLLGNPVSLSTTTDAQGGYLFPNLAPGTYTVQVDGTTLPAGLAWTGPHAGQTPGADFGNQDPTGYAVTVEPGDEILTADFGYVWGDPNGNTGPGAIGDRVWVDADGDGVQDPGEPGIGGVPVTIYYDSNGDGVVQPGVDLPYTGAVDQNGATGAGTTVTEPDGSYIFDSLPPGAYVVVVAPPPGYTQIGDPDDFGKPATSPDNRTTTPVVLGPGDVFLNADFGYQPPAGQNNRVGDRVWFDVNADGGQDAGEPGIPGVTVALIKDSNGDGEWDPNEPIIGTTTTVADGFYQFTGVPDGNYLAWVNDTDNVLAGKVQTYDSDGIATPHISQVDLDSAGVNANPVSNQDQDFGYTAGQHTPGKGLIGDTIFLDVNPGDGNVINPGVDQPLEGVTVWLYDSGGNLVATTITDENGNYSFGGLDPNTVTYEVRVDTTTLPPGLINSVDPDGGNDNASQVTLTPASPVNLDQDFGYRPSGAPGSIGNLVWKDTDADGVNDGPNGPDGQAGTDDDEPGIAGVTLNLYYDANGNGALDPGEPKVGSTTTAADGSYLFSSLPPGKYVVDVTDAAGVLAGYWHSLGDQAPGSDNQSKDDPHAVTLAAGQNYVAADFGYYVEPAAIGNFVWFDLNANGIQDASEPGIAGTTVKLTIGYPDGTQTTMAATTDANGFFSFGNLLLDEDYNGDGAGPEPSHTLLSVTPSGYAPTLVNASGSTTKDDSNDHAGTPAQPVQGLTGVAPKASPNDEQAIASYDFGYFQDIVGQDGALGNFVWFDANRDGIQDPGEPGIGGAIVNLTGVDVLGAVVSEQTTTIAAGPNVGVYAFPGLKAGNYTVSIDPVNFAPGGALAGFQSTTGLAGANRTVDSNGNPASTVLPEAVDQQGDGSEIDLTLDFGYVSTAAIGNTVWVDENSDGYQDAGEPGIPNVQVNLYDASGALVATTRTDAQGGYLFPNLLPGTYYVDVLDGTGGQASTLPVAGMTQTPYNLPGADFGNQNHSGTPIPSTGFSGYPMTIGAGQENLTADFGYNYNPTTCVDNPADPMCTDPTATLGDRVWVDADGDGVQDPNEVGIPGATVTLYHDPDGNGVYDTPNTVGGYTPTRTTDANGNYIFDGLPPGAYGVVVTPPPGYTQTGDPDDFGQPAASPDNRTTTPVVLGPGDVFFNADFGYQPPAGATGSIGNTVWFDADADGVGPVINGEAQGDAGTPDANEYGIPSVTVALIKDSNGDGVWDAGEPVIATDVTDQNGQYLFEALPISDGAGTDDYLVWVNDTDYVLGNLAPTYDADGLADPAAGVVSGANISAVKDLTPTPVTNQDFGYTAPGQTPGKGLIGDTVFLDRDANNQPGPGEGIEGVTVRLYDSGGNLVATTVTDENGNYYFGGLDPTAAYQVRVDTATLPAGLANTVDPDGTLDSQSVVNLGAPGGDGVNDPDGDNGINLGQDFGYRPSGTPGSIGNLVWRDTDADGVNDGPNGPDGLPGTDDDEPGIGGVTLNLYYDTDGDGKVDAGEPKVASTTTAAGGAYLFSNLPTVDNGAGRAGADYVVDVTDVSGVLGGYWHSLGTAAADNNSQADPYAASISAAAPDNLTADFGYYVEPAAIGNFVWVDLNADGIQDSGEAGLAGATVKLTITYANGAQTTVTTVTDAEGFYRFGNLLLDEDYRQGSGTATPGPAAPAHSLVATAPAGYAPSPVEQGGNTKLDSNNHAGASATPVQGLTDVASRANPNEEPVVASYDFGYYELVVGQQCSLSVLKSCVVPAPPPQPFSCSDAKPIDSLSMVWNGTQTVTAKAWKGSVGSTLLQTVNSVAPGQQVNVSGYAGAPNDVVWEIFAGSTKLGESTFHISCSDIDMNSADDCEKPAGNGKNNTAGLINTWAFDGMAGQNGVALICTQAPRPSTDLCEITLADAPSCESVGKPTTLTFEYTGGGCAATSNTQGGKATCTGVINNTLPVVVSSSNSFSINPATVQPGQEFTISSKFDANSYLTLGQGAKKEQLAIHTSCSQVLAVGDVFGSLTLVAFNGQRSGSNVTYNYLVTNNGDPLTNVNLVDDKLGVIATPPFDLENGQTKIFSKAADIFKTTTNVATASGTLADNSTCQATDSATVVVQEPCAVCKGGTAELTLQYLGSATSVTIYDDAGAKADRILFQGAVPADKKITLKPRSGQARLNNDISIWIGGVLHALIHTSCSQPIGPNAVFGDFQVVAARSKDNGRMCPLNACGAAADSTLAIKDKEVKWKITNNGDLPLVIERVSITWPAANGALDELKRDADVIHKGDIIAPSATINSGWDGAASKRTVGVGQTDELKFKFKNNAATNAAYTITLDLDQGCSASIEYKPGTGSSQSFTCSKPIDALTMQWDGAPTNVKITAWKGSVGTGTPLANQVSVAKGISLTVSGFAGSPNNVFWEIFDTDGKKLGESVFHLSCSDADMNSADDCNKRQGDAKGLAGYTNDWILKGMKDSDETFVCGP